MSFKLKFLFIIIYFACQYQVLAKDYYVHPKLGKDTNTGRSTEEAFKTLDYASTLKYLPGDRLLLATGQTYHSALQLINTHGTISSPIIITSIPWEASESFLKATIDFKGKANGILLEDCSFIEISHINLTGNGFINNNPKQKMRCAILITSENDERIEHINIKNVSVFDVYFENYGFIRDENEVKTANGTQKYGWGIRVINKNPKHTITNINIDSCDIKNVSHTGIKLSGINKNISNIKINNNRVNKTGGPGIQMSEVQSVYVANNLVYNSGSNDDSRKWGRGSGLWTWGSSKVLIEKNKFLYANGPGDSAGAHIDFSCDNIVLQYNLSAYNSGGFCEILGNNYNCSYRYNISINDGNRTKGVDGAFQEGKILWLSGYQGNKKERKGPVNTYFYNNTIYSDATVISKIAIDKTSKGILIANNIFYLEGDTKAVLGDQYTPDKLTGDIAKNVFFQNNLFLSKNNWPKDIGINDIAPIYGNPEFIKKGGIEISDYIPTNIDLIHYKGINITLLPNDTLGLLQSLKLEKDILGNSVSIKPSLGAIEPFSVND
jgi:hypothetical protein